MPLRRRLSMLAGSHDIYGDGGMHTLDNVPILRNRPTASNTDLIPSLCLNAAAQRAASEAAGAQDLLARDQQELERRRLAHRAAQQEQQVRTS